MNDEMILVPRAELLAWAKAWLNDYDPNDGTDCVTPFDTYLLKSPVNAQSTVHVEVLRHMKETIKAIMPSEVAALDAAIASLSAQQPPAEAQPVACDEDRFEQFLQAAIARSPEPLRELGEYLAGVLDDDQWPAADRLLLQLATATPSAPVGAEAALRDVLALSNKERDAEENREYGAANDLHTDLQGAAVNLIRDHGPALLSALEDARRYRALVDSGDFSPNKHGIWGLRLGGSKYSKWELDAAIDAAIAEGERR